ncbi:MAG: glycosyltransferase family 2 protein [Chloroflexota bacterium]
MVRDAIVEDRAWPRISIVTPSYNQAQYLEEAIRSVLLQGYPDLEYFVLDGGSTDGSAEIIQRYADHLAGWRVAPDDGQAAAIKEGLSLASGQLIGWLNSDDVLLPGSLLRVGRYFARNPDVECAVGGTIVIDQSGQVVRSRLHLPRVVTGEAETLWTMLSREGCSFYQPASFWRRSAYMSVGELDQRLRFAMDYDLYLRLAERRPFGRIPFLLAAFRVHPDSKTSTLQEVRRRECRQIIDRHSSWPRKSPSPSRGYLAIKNVLTNLPARIRTSQRRLANVHQITDALIAEL